MLARLVVDDPAHAVSSMKLRSSTTCINAPSQTPDSAYSRTSPRRPRAQDPAAARIRAHRDAARRPTRRPASSNRSRGHAVQAEPATELRLARAQARRRSAPDPGAAIARAPGCRPVARSRRPSRTAAPPLARRDRSPARPPAPRRVAGGSSRGHAHDRSASRAAGGPHGGQRCAPPAAASPGVRELAADGRPQHREQAPTRAARDVRSSDARRAPRQLAAAIAHACRPRTAAVRPPAARPSRACGAGTRTADRRRRRSRGAPP